MHFRTLAELEQAMKAARQLRAETLGGFNWIALALTGVVLMVRKGLQFSLFGTTRRI